MRYLTPYSFATLDDVLLYLKRDGGAAEGDRDACVAAMNQAVGWMAARTQRRLCSRSYRNSVAVAGCTVTADSKAVTGTGFLSLYVDDDLVGVGLAPGSRIESIASNAALTLNRPALATGVVTLTAGSAPLVCDGDNSNRIYNCEAPVSQVISARYRNADDSLTVIPTTGLRLDRKTGLLWLPGATFPRGELNIELECRAGYREPSALQMGDWDEWEDLKLISLRAAQVFFQDWINAAGRVVSKSLSQTTHTLPTFKMPDDIEQAIARYARVAA